MIPARPSWRIRRRIIVATLLLCAGEVIYLTRWGGDTELARTIANGVLLLAGTVIGSYVFGAAWDDKNVMEHRRARRRGPRGDAPPAEAEDAE